MILKIYDWLPDEGRTSVSTDDILCLYIGRTNVMAGTKDYKATIRTNRETWDKFCQKCEDLGTKIGRDGIYTSWKVEKLV